MVSPKNNVIVDSKFSGTRLDIFLSAKLEMSRSQVQKLIEQNFVTVNGKLPKKAGDRLIEGNKIEIAKSETTKNLKSQNKAGKTTKKLEPVKIIAATPEYIVVDKPTGMLTHPTMAEEKNALTEFLIKKYPEVKKVGDDPIRPGIAHRLDKEASGLLVVARTQPMFEHLKKQFKDRTINKEYTVLVHGKVAKDWGEINFPLRRSRTEDRMAAVPFDESDTKEAKTEFWIEKRFVNFTLLRVKIHTGRMHQIRAHFFAYGNPVVGDQLYLNKKQKRTWDEKLGRLFLHSVKLEFTDLKNEKQSFESPLPKKLSEFLKLLK
ncbi:MAG: RluA family pseudouridine synthase [Patescibacteria group bacterium]